MAFQGFPQMQMPSTSSLLSAYASMTTSIMLFRTMFDQLVPPQVRRYIIDGVKYYWKPKTTSKLTLVFEANLLNNMFDAAEIFLTRINTDSNRLRITKSEKEDQINVGLGEQVEMVDSFEGIPITWNYYNAIKTRYPGEPPLKRTMKLNHPSTFDTLAMDPKQKKMIIDDLDLFVKRRDFYKKVGKAWKRGYLFIKLPNRMTLNAMTKEPSHDDPKFGCNLKGLYAQKLRK
ncbi:AAA+ ATPase domain-containing protein [Artemisia annua]|uniref:AAA+ ATPase domain-containing protein n=1 Tax=Artemisia annua TaxID=35608 RepID=A0A2U1LRT0_ARTAN|nr:AAA+ ATPase domain-containing protein [Artemisia annua]